ncbi:PDR/VanB family oxidoreductase [Pseudooceanicola sp. HF7]|uniref:PDR/VanB family oxidoreductase n=1 Tax=Pseudooceanicola sp. HF7 TaxID=2721560 RepID=UPI0014303F98|nr:PDR/VanB family oxidoreductase [Pseudooceanicola sp. HF7]NIZ08583.1 oxidoreductase [Pseudooceanicola sp. HF7]
MTAHFANETGAEDAPVSQTQTLELRVEAIRYAAETVREVTLVAPDGAELPGIEPGGHVDLHLPGDRIRSYSLTNGPGETTAYVVAVNRDAASTGGSAHICEDLRVGTRLRVSTAPNNFPLAEAAESLFFAGGIGITPVLSMIRHLEARGAAWRLIYAVRSRAQAAFLSELQALDAGRGRLELHEDDRKGAVLDLAQHLAEAPEGAHLYCCGPTPMIDAFESLCDGRPASHVHVERFAGLAVEGAETAFTVVLKRKGLEFEVPPGKTIIEVLQENGVKVAYSCQSGVCGTCETRVIEGTPDHRDNLLSERERERGQVMLICCSLAKSDRLVLDI